MSEVANVSMLSELGELLDIGNSATVNIHDVSPDVLFDLMQDGRLDELKRERRTLTHYQDADAPRLYLVGKMRVEHIDVTLFTHDLPETQA